MVKYMAQTRALQAEENDCRVENNHYEAVKSAKNKSSWYNDVLIITSYKDNTYFNHCHNARAKLIDTSWT